MSYVNEANHSKWKEKSIPRVAAIFVRRSLGVKENTTILLISL